MQFFLYKSALRKSTGEDPIDSLEQCCGLRLNCFALSDTENFHKKETKEK